MLHMIVEHCIPCCKTENQVYIYLFILKNGYNTNLQFDMMSTNKNNEKKNKTRKQKITRFNPPFNINVATNVAKTFLILMRNTFIMAKG